MLAHLDDAVGTVRNKIHDLQLDEETLIALISDNGGPTKELTSSNRPLSGAKGELREGGIRVPYLMSWKDHIPSGMVESIPVASFDLTATALELAEATPKSGKLDGISLFSKGKNQLQALPDRTFYWRVGPKHAVRSGNGRWSATTWHGNFTILNEIWAKRLMLPLHFQIEFDSYRCNGKHGTPSKSMPSGSDFPFLVRSPLRENTMHDFTMHVGKSVIPSAVAIG